MSASGFTPIQLFRTSTAAAVPTAGNLAAGELAINLTDERLYFKNAAGVVKLLASNSGSLGTVTSVDVSGGTTGLTTSGGPITSSGTITLAGTLGVANGGTGTATAFTAGSVVFAGASGVYSQDNANFFWDDTNDRLGIGTSSPNAKLNVLDNSANDAVRITQTGTGNAFVVEDSATPDTTPFVITAAGIAVSGNPTAIVTQTSTARIQSTAIGAFAGVVQGATATNAATLDLARCRGTFAAPTIVSSGDSTGRVSFGGHDGVAYIEAAKIEAAIDGTPGTNDMPGRLVFSTTADGSASPTERMRIDASGNVGIGATTTNGKLTIKNPSASGDQVILNVQAATTTTSIGRVSYNQTDDTMRLFNESNFAGSALLFGVNNTERMRIDYSGNVGIGTSSPAYRLDVNGVARLGAGNPAILAGVGGAFVGGQGELYTISTNTMGLGTTGAASMQFYTSSVERARFTSDGRFFVGGATTGVGNELMLVTFNSSTAVTQALNMRDNNASGNGNSFLVLRRSDDTYLGAIGRSGTDSAMFVEGNSYLTLRTGGTERMRIDSSGNVGIGTNAPAYLLDVVGAGVGNGATQSLLQLKSASDAISNSVEMLLTPLISGQTRTAIGANREGATANAAIYMATNNTERMRIDSSGNLLWGTTSAGATGITIGSGGAISYSGSGSAQINNYRATNIEIVSRTAGYGIEFYCGAGSYAGKFDSSGNLLVGTTSTELGGSFKNVILEGGDGGIFQVQTPSAAQKMAMSVDSSAGYVGTRTNNPLVFNTNNTERARIDSSGNLLVGTTSSFGKVVAGQSGSNDVFYAGIGASGSAFTVVGTASTMTAGYFVTSSGLAGSITCSGTTTSYNIVSDSRAKHDIVDAPEASSLIDAIQVRSFKWNADDSEYRYGFIAQELVEVAPEAVHQPANPDEMMGVDYSKLVPMLVKEIQSLRARVAQLEGN